MCHLLQVIWQHQELYILYNDPLEPLTNLLYSNKVCLELPLTTTWLFPHPEPGWSFRAAFHHLFLFLLIVYMDACLFSRLACYKSTASALGQSPETESSWNWFQFCLVKVLRWRQPVVLYSTFVVCVLLIRTSPSSRCTVFALQLPSRPTWSKTDSELKYCKLVSYLSCRGRGSRVRASRGNFEGQVQDSRTHPEDTGGIKYPPIQQLDNLMLELNVLGQNIPACLWDVDDESGWTDQENYSMASSVDTC